MSKAKETALIELSRQNFRSTRPPVEIDKVPPVVDDIHLHSPQKMGKGSWLVCASAN